MSDIQQQYLNETQVEDLRDFNYISVNPLDRIEGTILPITIIPPSTPGWMPCTGDTLLISDYPILFDSIRYDYTIDDEIMIETGFEFKIPSIPNHLIKFTPMQNPFVLQSVYALKNVIKMELLSQRGDYNRDIFKGGILYEFIKKPLDDSFQDALKVAVEEVLNRYGNILTQSVRVERDTILKAWNIYILYSDLYNKYTSSISLDIED